MMIVGWVTPAIADIADADVEVIKTEIIKALKAEGKSDSEIKEAMVLLTSLDTGLQTIVSKLANEGELYALSELTKVLIDLVDQHSLLSGGSGCKAFVVYNHRKDMHLYSKFWSQKSKLDNGFGLKQMASIERTLAILVAPGDGETQLRTKEYWGLVDRMLVKINDGKLSYVNENYSLVIPLGETSCTKQ
jgi:hypothetical protein